MAVIDGMGTVFKGNREKKLPFCLKKDKREKIHEVQLEYAIILVLSERNISVEEKTHNIREKDGYWLPRLEARHFPPICFCRASCIKPRNWASYFC